MKTIVLAGAAWLVLTAAAVPTTTAPPKPTYHVDGLTRTVSATIATPGTYELRRSVFQLGPDDEITVARVTVPVGGSAVLSRRCTVSAAPHAWRVARVEPSGAVTYGATLTARCR